MKTKTNKNMYKPVKRAFNIFFRDAKSTFDRIMCICSALFWVWLEFMFLRFFFTYAFGMYYAVNGQYPQALSLILENKDFIQAITIGIVLITTVFRIPLYIKKEIKNE